MRRLLCGLMNAPRAVRAMWLSGAPLQLKNAANSRCTSSFQGDNACNGTHGKTALPDPQLFEDQFEELVAELTERDFADPALADALSRLREVSGLRLRSTSRCRRLPSRCLIMYLRVSLDRCWCTIPPEAKGTAACL